MEAQAQSTLIVAGIKYQLNKALSLAKTMPIIQAKTIEFLPFDQVQIAEVVPADPKLNHGEIVLFKRESKWIIITGRESVRRAVETGAAGFGARLLSAQALKRCKVDCFVHPDHDKPPRPVEHTHDDSYGTRQPQYSTNSYPRGPKPASGFNGSPRPKTGEDFRNAPRIIDKRQSPQPTYDRPSSTPSVFTKDVRTGTSSTLSRTPYGPRKTRPPTR